MTSYTLFSQTGGSALQSDPSPYTLGVQFTVSTACTLDGIWWFSASGAAALPQTIAVFLVSGQTLVHSESASWSGAAGSGWVFAAFASPPSLSASAAYEACVLQNTSANWYSVNVLYFTSGAGSGGITNGPLSAPNNASATTGQNLYQPGSTLAYPTTVTGDNFWVDVQVTPGGGLAVATAALANVAEGVEVRRWLSATGGTAPYTWSVTAGSLPAGLTLASDGTLSGTPTATGTSTFTAHVADSASNTATASLSVTSVSAPFSPSSPTTDGNGVITWSITSILNLNDAESVRVLNPTAPSSGYPHGFLFTLPVAAGTDDTSFGDGLDTVRTLGLHNAYNLTVIEPSTGGDWLADNPDNANLIQETYMLQAVAWAKSVYGTSGDEKIYLIGFSRTGLAGQGLFFHRPDLYAAVASWDFPAGMTTYDGTDATHGTVGGNPAGSYGTQDSYAANYELSAVNLAKWSAGQDFGTVNRIWIGGYSAFQADVTPYDPVLTAAGILHTTSLVAQSEHNWAPSPGWVATALAAIVAPVASGLLMASFP